MKDPKQISKIRENGTLDVATVNDEPSMTEQQWAAECDINNIMKKYQSTGQFTHLTAKQGIFADFTEIKDYQHMVETVQYAQDAFAVLPAEVRLKFNNNPGQLLAFLQDERNYEEGVRLGLLNKREPQGKNDQNEPAPKNAKKADPGLPPQSSTPDKA